MDYWTRIPTAYHGYSHRLPDTHFLDILFTHDSNHENLASTGLSIPKSLATSCLPVHLQCLYANDVCLYLQCFNCLYIFLDIF
jgi:hypothetical protein